MIPLFDLADLEMLACDCLTRAGVGLREARIVARDVALAESIGEPDCGFAGLLRDIRLIRYGRLYPSAPVEIIAQAPAVLRVDAGHGFTAPAAAQGLDDLLQMVRREGIAMLHVTRGSDPGALAGLLADLSALGLGAVAARPQAPSFAIAPGAERAVRLATGKPGMLDSVLALAPPPEDSPIGGPVAHSAWLTVLDPAATAAGELLSELPSGGAPAVGAVKMAPDLLAQIVNA